MGKRKRPIVTIDCETDPFKRGRDPMPFLWGAYDGERYRCFDDVAALLRWLAPQEVIVYAHNGGKFDYEWLYDFIDQWSEVLRINGRVVRFTIGSAEFRDSWSILPVPLRTYKKDQIDIAKLEPSVRHRHMEEIQRYNRGDCVYLHELVSGFVERYGQGLTLAGAAMKFWTTHFQQDKVETDANFYARHKPFYHGGRVQCFTKGEIHGGFQVVDINSAYPYAMRHHHPISTKGVAKLPVPSIDEPIIPQSLYHVKARSLGALPHKNEQGALWFPEDGLMREFWCTGWEIQTAQITGHLKKASIICRIDFGKDITFRPYVDHFYAMKAEAAEKEGKNSIAYVLAKLMQNSLYGKYGADPAGYCSAGIVPVQDIVTYEADPTLRLGRNGGPWKWAGMLGRHALMEGRDPSTGEANPVRSPYYNVATAASITGFVRAHLWAHIAAVRKLGGVVHYCDTDSIVFNLPGGAATPFAFSKDLGDWTHEGHFKYGAIAGKKMYAFQAVKPTWDPAREAHVEWKTACKGVRLDAQQICRIARGEEIVWEADAPQPSAGKMIKKGEERPKRQYLSRRVRMT